MIDEVARFAQPDASLWQAAPASSSACFETRGLLGMVCLAGPGYHINRSNLLVLESKADMQKRGQASPDDGDALALTFAQPVAPAEIEEEDEEEAFGRYSGSSNSGWMR
jgi:hypothetical protein